MNELKDDDLREALRRREARRAKPEVPADFCDSIMEEIAPRQSRRPMLWRWVALAASILLLIGIGVSIAPNCNDERLVAEQVKQELEQVKQVPEVNPSNVQTEKTVSTDALNTVYKQDEPTVQTVRTKANPVSKRQEAGVNRQEIMVRSQETIPNLHYAAYTLTEDSTYQAPSRMDEFIAKMAAFNEVEAVPMDCTPGDSMVVGMAYVFEDKQELDLFGRLLQAACWYDSKTPGYLLNFSHQQFFFTLKDLRKNEKYLWIAERINGGRILLFSNHSPIEANVSSACYQNYREQLTQTNFSTSHF
jgi:hypothetical protein